MNSKVIAEYIWVDSENNMRSKNRIISFECEVDLLNENIYPKWTFDGSSTSKKNDSTDNRSDIYLYPIAVYPNPLHNCSSYNCVIVLCATSANHNEYMNCKHICKKYENYEPLFGVEQEYMILDPHNSDCGYKWMTPSDPRHGHQDTCKAYYCSVGGDRSFGREIVYEHMNLCLMAGISLCGTNAEVVASQWEYQIGVCSPMKLCNDLMVSRYILLRLSEKYNCAISFDPKPISGWNGSGCHVNFSTKYTRLPGDGIYHIITACASLSKKHEEHMEVYGEDNKKRLCAKYETSSYDVFTYGIADRNASVRIPQHVSDESCGYLEDRRPAANMNPYLVIPKIIETVCG